MKKLILVTLVLFCLGLAVFIFTLPQVPDDLNAIALQNPTKIFSRNGQLVKVLANREVVKLEDISPYAIQAILALEDNGFYKHHGFSKKAFLRAWLTNIRHMRIAEGGSTITQQLAKNLFFAFDRTYIRKIKEFFIAVQIERQFSKDQILEAYLNQINFGAGIYGIELGAQTYFAKHADELTLAEAAMLAGIPRSIVLYNPYQNEKRAQERQSFVLKRMVDEDYITEQQRQDALQEKIELSQMNRLQGHAEYFTDEIRKETTDMWSAEAVDYGGLQIHTTLDPQFQYEASNAIKEGLAQLDELLGLPPYAEATWEEKLSYPQAALVALDTKSGAVRAMVGGRDYQRSPFNRALSDVRSVGSAFKPFNYFAALDKGLLTPITVLVDEPKVFHTATEDWEPRNFDEEYWGPVTVKWALMHSRNIVSAKIIFMVSPAAVVDCAHKFGITSPIDPNPSLALGATGVSPLDMAAAYSTFANEGIRRNPYFIERVLTSEGELVYKQVPESERVADPQTCYLMIDMLKGVVEGGTAVSVTQSGLQQPIAGKTGTTNDSRDAWFIGFTPDLSVAVWVGFDDNRVMTTKWGRGITGATGALPVWIIFMKKILAGKPFSDFSQPPGIEFQQVDPITGAGSVPGRPSIRVALRSGSTGASRR
jgi:1A family penicillin-binding protein